MAITKPGKQTIPPNAKNLDAPATQKRLRNQGKSANRFAPLTPEEDMDFEPEDLTAAPQSSNQPTPSAPPRDSTSTLTPADPFRNTTPSQSRQNPPEAPPSTPQPRMEPQLKMAPLNLQAVESDPTPASPTPLRTVAQTLQPQPQHPPVTSPVSHTHQPTLQAHLAMANEHCHNTTIQTHPPCHSTFPPHTARPPNGFPGTYLRHSTQLLDDMDPMVIATWDGAVTGPKLLARIFDYAANKADHDMAQEKIAAMRQVINGIDYVVRQTSVSDIKIAPPSRAQDAAAAPVAFLIYNVPETTYDALLHTRIWATPNITFELFPFDPTFPTFLFPLEGFVTTDTIRICEVVLHTWNSSTLYDEFTSIIFRHTNSLTDLTVENIMDYVANSFTRMTESLRVELLDFKKPKDVPSPIFNVFATLPTQDPKAWHDIRALLEKTLYLDPLNGIGKKGTLRQCQLCQCITHPRGLCPFPKLDGWLGPTVNQAPPQRENNSNKRRGRRNQT